MDRQTESTNFIIMWGSLRLAPMTSSQHLWHKKLAHVIIDYCPPWSVLGHLYFTQLRDEINNLKSVIQEGVRQTNAKKKIPLELSVKSCKQCGVHWKLNLVMCLKFTFFFINRISQKYSWEMWGKLAIWCFTIVSKIFMEYYYKSISASVF